MSFIAYVISEIFSVYIVYRGMHAISGYRRTNIWVEIVSYAIYEIITVYVYQIWNMPIITSISNLVLLYLVALNYDGKILEHIFNVIVVYIITMLGESFVMVFTQETAIKAFERNSKYVDRYMIAIMYLVQFFLFFLLEKFYENKKNERSSISILEMVVLISVMLGSIYLEMVIFTVLYKDNPELVFITDIVILIMNIAVVKIYYMLRLQYIREEREHILEVKSYAYENELRVMKESNQLVKMLRHDMKNHFLALEEYLSKSKIDEAHKYLQRLLDKIDESKRWVDTGNPELDSFINYKFDLAKKYDINCNIQTRIPEGLNIDVFSVSCILGNLLDNAITAAKETDNPEINVSLLYQKRNLFITISNPYNGKLTYRAGKLITAKENKGIHGYGLDSVKREVEKYNGSISIEHDKEIFNVNVMILLKKRDS